MRFNLITTGHPVCFFIAALMALLTVVVTIQPASADPFKKVPAEHNGRREMMQQKLGLTDAQVKALESARSADREKASQLKSQLMNKKKALMQYMGSTNANKAQAMTMQDEILRLEKQLSEMRINSWFDMREILTPEQLETMKTMREKRHSHGGGERMMHRQGESNNNREGDQRRRFGQKNRGDW